MNYTVLKYRAKVTQLDLHELRKTDSFLRCERKISRDEFGKLMCSGNHLMSMIVDHRVKSVEDVQIQEVMVWEAEAEVIEHDKANRSLRRREATGTAEADHPSIRRHSQPNEEDSNFYDWLLPDESKNKNALTSRLGITRDVLGEERLIRMTRRTANGPGSTTSKERGKRDLRKVLQQGSRRRSGTEKHRRCKAERRSRSSLF